MRQCFDELDVDRDGKISAEELENGLRKLGETIEVFRGLTRDILALVRNFDGDGDLRIDRIEFRASVFSIHHHGRGSSGAAARVRTYLRRLWRRRRLT